MLTMKEILQSYLKIRPTVFYLSLCLTHTHTHTHTHTLSHIFFQEGNLTRIQGIISIILLLFLSKQIVIRKGKSFHVYS